VCYSRLVYVIAGRHPLLAQVVFHWGPPSVDAAATHLPSAFSLRLHRDPASAVLARKFR